MLKVPAYYVSIIAFLAVAVECSCLVALCDERCYNDDAIFDTCSIPLSYIGKCVIVMREAEVAAYHLSL